MKRSLQNAKNGKPALRCAKLLSLIFVTSISACSSRSVQSPPVLFKPSKIQAPDPQLMLPPSPSGTYSRRVAASLSKWDEKLTPLLIDLPASNPGHGQP